MFKFLKEKLKGAISKFSKEVEKAPEVVEEKPAEEVKEEKIEVETKEIIEEPKLKEKIEEKEKIEGETKEVPEVEEKKGFFGKLKEKLVTKKISDSKFQDMFNELELTLLENNVAVEVIDKIKDDLKKNLIDKPIKRNEVNNIVVKSLKKSLEEVLDMEKLDLVEKTKNKKDKPYVIVFFGINGSGKTTTIAKLAKLLLDNDLKCILVAADTFRAAAIQQLEEHGKKLGVKVIKHDYNADPTAVAFDGKKYGEAHKIDVVLIDTAGRQHSNVNLVNQMQKLVRVIKPDLRIFVGESITGNDCINQAKQFNDNIGIDGIILTKADVDEKGGAAISIEYVTKKPILYLGNGQNYSSLKEFNSEDIIKSLGL